jgi:hypothetical protein
MDRIDTPPLTTIPYTVHHIQYRSLSTCQPHLKCFVEPIQKPSFSRGLEPCVTPTFDNELNATRKKNEGGYPKKQQGLNSRPLSRPPLPPNATAIYLVRPSTMFDIYYLISMESLRRPGNTYTTEVAHIPDYKTSIWMNSLFRRIKENECLDAIEESDDEDEFEDVTPNKYVFLHREYYMECMYHRKFRKWVPLRVVDPPRLQNQIRTESSRKTQTGVGHRPREDDFVAQGTKWSKSDGKNESRSVGLQIYQ